LVRNELACTDCEIPKSSDARPENSSRPAHREKEHLSIFTATWHRTHRSSFDDLLFLLAGNNVAHAIAERAYRSADRPMTEADFIIIATAIAVVGVIIVGVIVNVPERPEFRGRQGRREPH
jgi:hypothetical protein